MCKNCVAKRHLRTVQVHTDGGDNRPICVRFHNCMAAVAAVRVLRLFETLMVSEKQRQYRYNIDTSDELMDLLRNRARF